MRTLSGTLSAEQKDKTTTPYIEIRLASDLSGATVYTYISEDNKIKFIKHVEEPYNDWAIIVLDNSALGLATDLSGYLVYIGYGYKTSSGNEYSSSAPLWVKKQFHTSKMGSLDTVLYCEGAWTMLGEIEDIASLINSEAGSAPYYQIDYSGSGFSIYDVINDVLEAADFGIHELGSNQFANDGILDTLQPAFAVNTVDFENARQIIYRLMMATKSFVRAEYPTGGEFNACSGTSVEEFTWDEIVPPDMSEIFTEPWSA